MKKALNLKLTEEENDLLLEIDQRPEIFNLVIKIMYDIIAQRQERFLNQSVDLAELKSQSNFLQYKIELQGMQKLTLDFSNLKDNPTKYSKVSGVSKK